MAVRARARWRTCFCKQVLHVSCDQKEFQSPHGERRTTLELLSKHTTKTSESTTQTRPGSASHSGKCESRNARRAIKKRVIHSNTTKQTHDSSACVDYNRKNKGIDPPIRWRRFPHDLRAHCDVMHVGRSETRATSTLLRVFSKQLRISVGKT